ncbi:MAG TPA: branched-chain amino acid ABC transporter permease [Burkholderiaceae bacterium]
MNTVATTPADATAGPPGFLRRIDWLPLGLLPLVCAVGYVFIGSGSTWFTLSVAGLAMGMIIFIIASGLTLIFGLMDVFNFGHGIFIALGAFVAMSVLGMLGDWTAADNLGLNLAALGLAALAAMTATAIAGLIFERLLIRRVYGQHLKQILITMGGMVVGEELIKMFWGPQQAPMPLPAALSGSLEFGDAAVEKYRLLALAVGIAVYLALILILNRTKIGLLVRAGVQDREMVESLGYRIDRLFIGVFMAGSALAGLGGVMWGLYQQGVAPQMGAQVNVIIFMVIIIGGLGSTAGSFLGAILMGLAANYVGFLAPAIPLTSTLSIGLTPFSNILLMVAILLWRPQGLFSGSK